MMRCCETAVVPSDFRSGEDNKDNKAHCDGEIECEHIPEAESRVRWVGWLDDGGVVSVDNRCRQFGRALCSIVAKVAVS